MVAEMNAIRVEQFGEPEVMQLVEVVDPQISAGQVLVKIRAAGVNPVETYIRAGIYARKPQLPYTPGTDGAGVVSAVGPDAGSFKPGDRVFLSGSLSGTYAELAVCTPDQVPRSPGGCELCPGRRAGNSVCDGVSRFVSSRAGAAR